MVAVKTSVELDAHVVNVGDVHDLKESLKTWLGTSVGVADPALESVDEGG